MPYCSLVLLSHLAVSGEIDFQTVEIALIVSQIAPGGDPDKEQDQVAGRQTGVSLLPGVGQSNYTPPLATCCTAVSDHVYQRDDGKAGPQFETRDMACGRRTARYVNQSESTCLLASSLRFLP